MRPEMKFRFVMKKFLFTLLFIVGEMKFNFVSGVVDVKQAIKNYKHTGSRYRDKHVGASNAGI